MQETPHVIPGLRRSTGEGIGYLLQHSWASLLVQLSDYRNKGEKAFSNHQVECLNSIPCGSSGKESACNAGDVGLILGLGRSPGEGNSYPLQYFGLENFMDCIIHGVAKSQTQLTNLKERNK